MKFGPLIVLFMTVESILNDPSNFRDIELAYLNPVARISSRFSLHAMEQFFSIRGLNLIFRSYAPQLANIEYSSEEFVEYSNLIFAGKGKNSITAKLDKSEKIKEEFIELVE